MIVLGLCFLQNVIVWASSNAEVTLTSGRVRGQMLVSLANRNYFSFQGIPYASPPVGNLRFKAPRPPESWVGTLDAFKIPPACSQPWRKLDYPEHYSEDCLYVNVFTPYLKPPKGQLMPVMVWIHGGKNYQGSSTSLKYGADFLMTENVVVVTFNYRLGVFGFLNAHSKSAQGNAATKDTIAALRWVQKEIKKFGGDPYRVTIFGGSSGGMLVNCLYLSPLAQGLFHRAIAQSAGNCNVPLPPTKDLVRELAKLLGCQSSDVEDIIACLRNTTNQDLAEKQMDVIRPLPHKNENPFTLTVEEDHGEEMFLPKHPEVLLKDYSGSVPFLSGINSFEGLMYVTLPEENPSLFSEFEKDFEYYIPSRIRKIQSRRGLKQIIKQLKGFYFGNEHASMKTVYGFINFMTDVKFTYPVTQLVKSIADQAPVYLYYFAFEGEFELPHKFDTLNLKGVCHGDELGYLFNRCTLIPQQKNMTYYPREQKILTQMVRLWTNFARYGNPTVDKSDNLLNVTWLPVNSSLTQHIVINDSLLMVTENLLAQRLALWESIGSLTLAPEDEQIFVGLYIIAGVTCLSFTSLLYLLYTSSCTKGYMAF